MRVATLMEHIWKEAATPEEPDGSAAHEREYPGEVSRSGCVQEEQIRALVQQLFFGQEFPLVRHVGVVAPDSHADTGPLCVSMARVLAEDESRAVGLIEASPGSMALPIDMKSAPSNRRKSGREIAPRLWVVPSESWMSGSDSSPASDQNVCRLRQIASGFDFSLLRCPPTAWLASRVAQGCDGLVLVLTANKTRRLVAAQMRDQLRSAGIPVLGTVLTGRRFPVPQGLYRNL